MPSIWGPEEEAPASPKVKPRRVFTPQDPMSFDSVEELTHAETHPANHSFCKDCKSCRICDCMCDPDDHVFCEECDGCRTAGCDGWHDRCECDD